MHHVIPDDRTARFERAHRVCFLALAVAAAIGVMSWTGPTPLSAEMRAQAVEPAGSGADGSDANAVEEAEPGSELRVWLVTAGPGDQVWERYGHNAIRVLDTQTGRDASYNWGIFDFDQVDFIPRFLQGRMLYRMAAFNTDAMLGMYRAANREVLLQELALPPAQKLELLTLAEINARPENAEYVYQYFTDNCSTRVRDLLNTVLDGALEDAMAGRDSGTSFRDNTRRLTQVDPLIYTGMDLLLGSPTDAPISVWEQAFLPLTLQREVRDLSVADGAGGRRPLVANEEVAVEATREPAPTEAPSWLWFFLLLGAALGLFFGQGLAGRLPTWPGRLAAATATLWLTLSGLLGTILVLLLFTDHTFAFWNENLFLFHPVLLLLAPLVLLAGRSEVWLTRARALAGASAGLAIVGLLWQLAPFSVHENAIFLAVALPPLLGVAWGLSKREPEASAG